MTTSKRSIDLILVIIILPLLIVPAILVASLIKITSKGPVLYWSSRVGRNNVIFQMPKFRSMVPGTPSVATHLLQDGASHLIPFGSFIRRTSLDEIPQIYSVLRGHMSLVGPRPALFNQLDLISLRSQKGIHQLIPGITGWAQINGRDDLSISEKVDLDSFYLQHQSIFFDFKILFLTCLKIKGDSTVAH